MGPRAQGREQLWAGTNTPQSTHIQSHPILSHQSTYSSCVWEETRAPGGKAPMQTKHRNSPQPIWALNPGPSHFIIPVLFIFNYLGIGRRLNLGRNLCSDYVLSQFLVLVFECFFFFFYWYSVIHVIIQGDNKAFVLFWFYFRLLQLCSLVLD